MTTTRTTNWKNPPVCTLSLQHVFFSVKKIERKEIRQNTHYFKLYSTSSSLKLNLLLDCASRLKRLIYQSNDRSINRPTNQTNDQPNNKSINLVPRHVLNRSTSRWLTLWGIPYDPGSWDFNP